MQPPISPGEVLDDLASTLVAFAIANDATLARLTPLLAQATAALLTNSEAIVEAAADLRDAQHELDITRAHLLLEGSAPVTLRPGPDGINHGVVAPAFINGSNAEARAAQLLVMCAESEDYQAKWSTWHAAQLRLDAANQRNHAGRELARSIRTIIATLLPVNQSVPEPGDH